jgi:hypothetical protein
MSAMSNLDLMVKGVSMTDEEYENNKALISRHMNGEIVTQDLPQHLKDILFEWETDELELNHNIEQPKPWEDYGNAT